MPKKKRPKVEYPVRRNLQLEALRTLRGYPTRISVAKAARVSEPTVWRIETSDRPARPESLTAYAAELGLAVDELQMLRRPAEQAQMFIEARVVILPVETWGILDAAAKEHGESVSEQLKWRLAESPEVAP